MTLNITFKTRNGRRVSHDFPITADYAADPAAKAAAITSATTWGDQRGWRLVNWKVEDR